MIISLQVLDWHLIVRGRNRSSGHLFSQGDVLKSWWMNHRLEVLMVQPPPTLKSSSTSLCFPQEKKDYFEQRCLNNWPPHMGRGWPSELESLQNCPPSTGIGSDILLLLIQRLWEGWGTWQAWVVLSSGIKTQWTANASLDSNLCCWLALSLGHRSWEGKTWTSPAPCLGNHNREHTWFTWKTVCHFWCLKLKTKC